MKFMEATYICHWIKRRIMETTDIHLSDLYDTDTREKELCISASFKLKDSFYIDSIKLQYSERIKSFEKKNYSSIEK